MHDGEAAAIEGIEAALEHSDEAWRDIAIRAAKWLSISRHEFTTDDVWGAIELYYPNASTREHRAMGGVMRLAASAGWIEATDRTQKSDRVVAHRRPVRVWRSLL